MSARTLLLAALALGAAACGATSGEVPTSTVRLFEGRRVTGRYIGDKAYAHYLRGDLFSLAGNAEAAADEFRYALAFDPEAVELHHRLAEELTRLGRFDEALAAVRAALACDSRDAETLMLLGRLRARTGHAAAALAAYGEAVRAEPDNEQPGLVLADVQAAAGDLPGAVATLTALCRRLPRAAEAELRLGRLLATRAPAAAIEHLRRSLELESGRPEVMVELAELLVQAGEGALAVATLRDALERTGDKVGVAERLIRLLLDRGDRQAALDVVGLLDEGTPGDPRQLVILASLSRALKDLPRALGQAEAALKLKPDLHVARLIYGLLLEEARRPREAVAAYLAVPPAADEFVDARRRAAEALRGQGRAAEAVAALEQALAQKADGEELVEALALALVKSGQAERALARVQQALTQRPGSETLQYALASVYEQIGQWQKGIEEARRLLARSPRHAAALNFIGFTLAEHGVSLEEAEHLIAAALAIRPGDGFIQDSLGWVYYKLGRLDDAQRVLDQANRVAPNEPEILKHLGEVYARRREPGRAAECFRQALERNPDDKLRRELEEQLRRLGPPPAARP